MRTKIFPTNIMRQLIEPVTKAAQKYTGKTFEEIEDDVALDYEKNRVGSALPWDQARPATRAAWDKVSGVVTPRDPDRGTRSGF
jgi:hypothetical protein